MADHVCKWQYREYFKRSDVAGLLLLESSFEAKGILYAGYKLRLALISPNAVVPCNAASSSWAKCTTIEEANCDKWLWYFRYRADPATICLSPLSSSFVQGSWMANAQLRPTSVLRCEYPCHWPMRLTDRSGQFRYSSSRNKYGLQYSGPTPIFHIVTQVWLRPLESVRVYRQ